MQTAQTSIKDAAQRVLRKTSLTSTTSLQPQPTWALHPNADGVGVRGSTHSSANTLLRLVCYLGLSDDPAYTTQSANSAC